MPSMLVLGLGNGPEGPASRLARSLATYLGEDPPDVPDWPRLASRVVDRHSQGRNALVSVFRTTFQGDPENGTSPDWIRLIDHDWTLVATLRPDDRLERAVAACGRKVTGDLDPESTSAALAAFPWLEGRWSDPSRGNTSVGRTSNAEPLTVDASRVDALDHDASGGSVSAVEAAAGGSAFGSGSGAGFPIMHLMGKMDPDPAVGPSDLAVTQEDIAAMGHTRAAARLLLLAMARQGSLVFAGFEMSDPLLEILGGWLLPVRDQIIRTPILLVPETERFPWQAHPLSDLALFDIRSSSQDLAASLTAINESSTPPIVAGSRSRRALRRLQASVSRLDPIGDASSVVLATPLSPSRQEFVRIPIDRIFSRHPSLALLEAIYIA